VLRHHFEHLRKIHQRDEGRVESLLLRCVGERSSGEARILREPVVDVEYLLRIRGCGSSESGYSATGDSN
jgi:hypothetical protein